MSFCLLVLCVLVLIQVTRLKLHGESIVAMRFLLQSQASNHIFTASFYMLFIMRTCNFRNVNAAGKISYLCVVHVSEYSADNVNY